MVAGSVKAEKVVFNSIHGMPMETDLKVVDLPPENGGKVIGDGTDMARFTDEGDVVKVTIERGRFKFLKFNDVLSLVDSQGEPFDGGAYIKDHSDVMGKSRLTLFDKDDKPLCLAVQEKLKINKAYWIFGTKPLKDGDVPQDKEGDVDFYPWYRVRDIDDSHLDWRSLLIWNGNNYQPCLRINPAKRPISDDPNVSDLLPPKKGDNKVCLKNDPDTIYACMNQKSDLKERRWDLIVSPGADVMAMIMLGAIMDDMVGWFA